MRHTEDFEGSHDIYMEAWLAVLSELSKKPWMTFNDPKMTLNIKIKNADNVFLKEHILLNTSNFCPKN